MQEISGLKLEPSLKVIAFDMDDTLTQHGQLPAKVLQALEDAQSKKWLVVLVTGRPAGWADALIKLLPFDGVVSENGALIYYWPQRKSARKAGQEPSRLYWTKDGYSSTAPQDLKVHHDRTRAFILSQHPRARVASDQPFRFYDLAIDFAEEVTPPLKLEEAKKIQVAFESQGATAKISSIHVNGWWGDFSKAEALKELLVKYNLTLDETIYVGDSPNDGPLFAVAKCSIGVANVRAFAALEGFHLPHWVTKSESAQGALEVLAKLPHLK